MSPRFFVQVSFVPVGDVAFEPSREQNWPARAPPCAGLAEYQRARLSPGFFWQRAHAPVVVLPTVPVVAQNPPTRTVPGTVAEAAGAAPGGRCRTLAVGLWAMVAAFLLPPHPVSAMAALRAIPVKRSGRFIWSPDSSGPGPQLRLRD